VDDFEFVDLLRRAQHGDELAFNILFRATQPVLLRYVATIAGAGLADDIAAETWVNVVRDLDRFVGAEFGAFRGWALSIARRRWVDEMRRRGRRPEVLMGDAPETVAGHDVAGSAEQTMGTERALALIKTLPPDQAEVLILRVIADLDVTQTAEIVGKTPGAVRVLAHRGLRALDRQLRPGVTKSAATTVED
jgi:RNA polymerase sigma-70 factor (ECF subfamily)